MIRIACPKCKERLVLDDDTRGQLGQCPQCSAQFRIPAAKIAAAVQPSSAVSRRPSRPMVVESVQEGRPRPRPPVVDAIDADEPPSRRDEDTPRPRRKKRRRRNRSPGEVLANLSFPMLLACLVGVTVLLVLLELLFPPFVFVSLLLGIAMLLLGRIWFLLLAFRESVLMGLGCLLVPFVDLVFLIRNWHETWRPFTLSWTAILVLFLASVMYPRPKLADFQELQRQQFQQQMDLQRQRFQQQRR